MKHLRKWAAWWLDSAGTSLGPAFGIGGTGGAFFGDRDPRLGSTQAEPKDSLTGRADIAEECSAFLAGRYLRLMDRRRVKPGWVYVNAVAHVDGDGLDQMARNMSSESELGGGLSYVAQDVLLFCRRYEIGLRDLQRDVLVPLEFELMAQGGGSLPDVTRTLEACLATYGKVQPGAVRPGGRR